MHKEKTSIYDLRMDYWRERRHPFTGGIEITPYCNFHCVHCYLSDYAETKLLSTSELKLIMDKLYTKGVLFLYFTGGEILMRPDFVELYLYAKKKGFIMELLTNISLLDEEIADMFAEYPPANISISVYGASNETYKNVTGRDGMFDTVVQSLHSLHKRQLHMELKFIALNENISDFYAVKRIAESFSCFFSHTFELFPTLNGNLESISHMLPLEDIVDFERHYSKTANVWACSILNLKDRTQMTAPLYMCDIALTNFLVDSEGYLNPCNKLRTKRFNLLHCSFDEAWSAFAEYRDMKAPDNYPCPGCKLLGMCNPCVAENLLFTGNSTTPPEVNCKLTHLRYEEFSQCKYDALRQAAEEDIAEDGAKGSTLRYYAKTRHMET